MSNLFFKFIYFREVREYPWQDLVILPLPHPLTQDHKHTVIILVSPGSEPWYSTWLQHCRIVGHPGWISSRPFSYLPPRIVPLPFCRSRHSWVQANYINYILQFDFSVSPWPVSCCAFWAGIFLMAGVLMPSEGITLEGI